MRAALSSPPTIRRYPISTGNVSQTHVPSAFPTIESSRLILSPPSASRQSGFVQTCLRLQPLLLSVQDALRYLIPATLPVGGKLTPVSTHECKIFLLKLFIKQMFWWMISTRTPSQSGTHRTAVRSLLKNSFPADDC